MNKSYDNNRRGSRNDNEGAAHALMQEQRAFRQQVEDRLEQFAEVLPPQITPQQFKSVLMSAVVSNPDLLRADRVSLFGAALAAAQDGLLPDKREGAIVIYKTKEGDDWIQKAQWMPMIQGVIQKVWNAGGVKSISVEVVRKGENFRRWTDEEGEHLFYERAFDTGDSDVIGAFAQVVYENGGAMSEAMDIAALDKVKNASKNVRTDNNTGKKKITGPWADWPEEMQKKTVFRRLAKRLRKSREIQQVLDRDNALYDMQQHEYRREPAPRSLAGRLDALAGPAVHQQPMEMVGTEDRVPAGQKSTGSQPRESSQGARQQASDDGDRGKPSSDATNTAAARQAGAEAKSKGQSRKSMPAEYRSDETLMDAWLQGFEEAEGQANEQEA